MNPERVQKRLLPGQVRYVAKVYEHLGPRKAVWGVYDRARGSWPGSVPIHTSQASAQADADLLNAQ